MVDATEASFDEGNRAAAAFMYSGLAAVTVASVSGLEVESGQTRIAIASGLTRIALMSEGARIVTQARRED